MSFEFTLDTQAPAALGLSLANDTGGSPTDRITSDGTLSVTALESGARVEYSTDGQVWGTSYKAVDGANSVLVRQIDLAGNASVPTTFDFVFDAQSPVAPLVALIKDTGSSAVDRVTSDGKLSTAMPIATLFNTGVDTIGNVAPNWATDLHYTLVTVPGGTDVVRVATDANGYPIGPWIGGTNLSAWIGPASDSVLSGPGGSYVYRTTFDLTGFDPGAVSISGGWAMDDIGDEIRINGQSRGYATWGWSGYSAFAPFSVTGGFVAGINTLDFVVSNGGGPTGLRVEMTGTGSTVEAGATVEYSIDDGVTWSGTFNAAEGNNRVLLRQIDLAGNISQPKLYEFTLDSTIPNAPVVSLLNDNGSSASDRITSDGTLSVTALESGARVEYSTDGMSWSASLKVAEGPNSVGVRQIDQAGNVSPATTFDFTFDSSIPRNHLFKGQFGTGPTVDRECVGALAARQAHRLHSQQAHRTETRQQAGRKLEIDLPRLDHPVGAVAAVERIAAGATREGVVAGEPRDHVVMGIATNDVVECRSDHVAEAHDRPEPGRRANGQVDGHRTAVP